MTRDEAIALARKHHAACTPGWCGGIPDCVIAAIMEAANGRWRPMSEAPKDYSFVLAIEASGYIHIVQWCCENHWRGNTDDAWNPAHWQPLPPPPTA